jgi:hypothetical protein
MVYSAVELTTALANLAPVTASWSVLCLNRGDFEGGGAVVDRGVFRRASREPLTTIRTRCSSRRGDVPSPRAQHRRSSCSSVRRGAAGAGMAARIDSDGDGAPAGLTSWFDPAKSREEGSRVRPPRLRGRGALAVQEWAAHCHGADTALVAQFPAVVGMGFP